MLCAMGQTVYLNGAYVPLDQARISPMDRGFLFADGVYEVVRYYAGKPLAMAEHVARMAYSLSELKLFPPIAVASFADISDELVQRNEMADASVYWQITRGPAKRVHSFPDVVEPTVFATCDAMPPLVVGGEPTPMRAATHEETRWAKCTIKSIALLPNVLARQAAVETGCDEAIFTRSYEVTEGTARSILVVIDGKIVTHPLDGRILGSITRKITLDLAEQLGIEVEEQAPTVTQLIHADEVMAVGTTTEIRPIVEINEHAIGGGRVGPITKRLHEAFVEHVRRECGID